MDRKESPSVLIDVVRPGNLINDMFVPDDTEFDLQAVLDSQNTHNLFCPNCLSCITTMVVVQRRRCRPSRPRPTHEVDIAMAQVETANSTEPRHDTIIRNLDILKCIVYGGLVESVASLSVVFSAAGGGASTLNTLALALANIISGLFILILNLQEMKSEHLSLSQDETGGEQDRYYQSLGRRGKFTLHATVAIISFLVFGSVAPITYAFSFYISDNREYKLIAVAAASLVCILLLALGKARVKSRYYVKTAAYYLMMGFVASVISFVAGSLFYKLLEQLGLFNLGSSSASVAGFLSETSQRGSGWDSY